MKNTTLVAILSLVFFVQVYSSEQSGSYMLFSLPSASSSMDLGSDDENDNSSMAAPCFDGEIFPKPSLWDLGLHVNQVRASSLGAPKSPLADYEPVYEEGKPLMLTSEYQAAAKFGIMAMAELLCRKKLKDDKEYLLDKNGYIRYINDEKYRKKIHDRIEKYAVQWLKEKLKKDEKELVSPKPATPQSDAPKVHNGKQEKKPTSRRSSRSAKVQSPTASSNPYARVYATVRVA